jgi:hypothetical protein
MYAHLGKRNLPEDDSGDSSLAKAKQSALILALLVASLLKSRDRMSGSCRDEKATIAHVIPSPKISAFSVRSIEFPAGSRRVKKKQRDSAWAARFWYRKTELEAV